MKVNEDLSYTERMYILEMAKVMKAVKGELMGPSDITAIDTIANKMRLANKTEIIMSSITKKSV